MKEKPGKRARLSLPIPVRGEPGRNDSDPETPPKRHCIVRRIDGNNTPENNTMDSLWAEYEKWKNPADR